MRPEELKALRRGAGLKGYQMAEKLGLHPSTWSDYERGHRPAPLTVQYAVRYLCQPKSVEMSRGDRLLAVLKNILEEEMGGPQRPE